MVQSYVCSLGNKVIIIIPLENEQNLSLAILNEYVYLSMAKVKVLSQFPAKYN